MVENEDARHKGLVRGTGINQAPGKVDLDHVHEHVRVNVDVDVVVHVLVVGYLRLFENPDLTYENF